MRITEVNIRLADGSDEHLKAFASMLIDDCFVVKELRIISDKNRRLFVSMPDRKLTDRCHRCRSHNTLRSRFCHMCGASRPPDRGFVNAQGKTRYNEDVAFPVNAEARRFIEHAVLGAYIAKTRQRAPDRHLRSA